MSKNKPDAAILDLIRRSGDPNPTIANAAQMQLAMAVQIPLREAILPGPILTGIYDQILIPAGASVEFPLSSLVPGEEDQYTAYTHPGNGRIPEANIEGDYVAVPTWEIANSIDWLIRFQRDARYDVSSDHLRILEAGFVKKVNDSGFETILAAGADRNIVVYDADAPQGAFTKRLVSQLSTVMRRAAGGNSASLNRGKLTDMLVSPEAIDNVRNWGLTEIDEFTRREIYNASPDSPVVNRVMGVNLHDLDELGQDQQYQDYYLDVLGGSLAGNDVELVVGLDLSNSAFLMPVREELSIWPDPTFHRQGRVSFYGRMELGFFVPDSRKVILGSF